MQATAEDTAFIQKTRELCETLLNQPEFQQIRRSIDTFMADDGAKSHYQSVMEQGDSLQHKQQTGVTLDGGEIAEFEKSRDSLLANSVAREFIDAQQQMHKMQESVMQYVSKTFELGRVPTSDDLSGGGCGSGCGCG